MWCSSGSKDRYYTLTLDIVSFIFIFWWSSRGITVCLLGLHYAEVSCRTLWLVALELLQLMHCKYICFIVCSEYLPDRFNSLLPASSPIKLICNCHQLSFYNLKHTTYHVTFSLSPFALTKSKLNIFYILLLMLS